MESYREWKRLNGRAVLRKGQCISILDFKKSLGGLTRVSLYIGNGYAGWPGVYRIALVAVGGFSIDSIMCNVWTPSHLGQLRRRQLV